MPKVKVLIPMYEPLELAKCKKCGKTIAEPKECEENNEHPTEKRKRENSLQNNEQTSHQSGFQIFEASFSRMFK